MPPEVSVKRVSFRVLREIAMNTILRPDERGVLLYIMGLPFASPSQLKLMVVQLSYIAKMNGVGQDKIQRMMRRFKEVGYCKIHRPKDGLPYIYEFTGETNDCA